jgi:hypothetical protein
LGPVYQVDEKEGVGEGFGAMIGRFADASTFLWEAHRHLSVIVNMCILSNKIQLVRLFWAVVVMHFLCCDCSEDRVALTTVRSPNKNPKNSTALFSCHTLFLFLLSQMRSQTISTFPFSTKRLSRVT